MQAAAGRNRAAEARDQTRTETEAAAERRGTDGRVIVDPRTGFPIQRHIADPRGNIAFEPLGGSTVSGQNPVDTHTLYPNGSDSHRMNPQRHGSGKPPHGHGHLMGTGPNTKGQGLRSIFVGI